MFDNTTFLKTNLTDKQKLQIIDKNNLQSVIYENQQKQIYHNSSTKNLTGGILIQIENTKLKIEGSIHKYFHYLQYGSLENYTVFTMQDFSETIKILFENIGIAPADFLVINYEIGINVYIESGNPIDYLKKVKSIGNLDGTQRKMYINAKYREERFLSTMMHKNNTLIFRIYDKDFERQDKGKTNKIAPCIRIETQHRKQKNISLVEFCQLENLILVKKKFFTEWNKLNFDKEISAPPRTGQNKKDIAKNIILDGSIVTLQNLEERRNQLTPKIYRNQREFILNWDKIKFDFHLIDCEIMPLWAKAYNASIQSVTNRTIKI